MNTVSRLINKFNPTHYELSLDLEREKRQFSGVVSIYGERPSGDDSIILHSKDLAIESITVDGKLANFQAGENDELSIKPKELNSTKHAIVIAFSGSITDSMHGLYPCYYDHNGEKKELLATQFESHHAREVFPCVDEPEAKATFDVTLSTEEDVTVLGNMPIQTQHTENSKLVTRFETTPRMSTYLLAFVVGQMHKKSATTSNGVEVNIWATPAQTLESLDFALDIATRTIEFFDEYFGVPYPLPKSDHVALPDFSSGAMENWGLITYREIALLADPSNASVSSKHYIATVIAHELSHQWFGNLVTMRWWNNLWLNESFATLMEYIAVDALEPSWNIWLDFASHESILALRRDSIEGVQPVQVDVNHPDEISTLFDGAIVYAKGARLLRMLQHHIGHEAFKTGLQKYFSTHAYGNTEENDLWDALSEASGKDIAKLMNPWISRSGYPVVSVHSESDSQATLRQEQFLINPDAKSDRVWPIPLNTSQSGTDSVMNDQKLTIKVNPKKSLRLNVGDSAHFITHYDDASLSKIIATDASEGLRPLDRLQLLHEQTLLARGERLESYKLLGLLNTYRHETSEAVWGIISMATGELKKFVELDSQAELKLRQFTADLARKQYDRLGWKMTESESEEDTKLRSTITSMMIYGQDPDAIAAALDIYKNVAVVDIDSNIRPSILGAAIRYGDDDSIADKLIKLYAKTSSAELRSDIISGLTNTHDEDVASRLLDSMQDKGIVKPQDAAHWFVYLIRNRYSRQQAWQWLQDNWGWIEATYSGDKSYDAFPRYAASALATRQQLIEYREFFTPLQSNPSLTRVIKIGKKEIEARVRLIEGQKAAVEKALLNL